MAITVNTHIRVCGLLLFLLCLGCNRSHSNTNAPVSAEWDLAFVKDSIYKAVVSKYDTAVSYSLLLPSTYDPQKKHPLFLFLDPHADGALPLEKYRTLASSFDAVCIGSNNAKNGIPPDQSISLVKTAVHDVCARFSIDSQAVFLVGFSGGARLAGTMVAQGFPAAGMIACSAAIPFSSSLKNISVCLVAGLDDANLTEQLALEEYMIQQNQTPVLYCFKGGHTWAADTIMQHAMQSVLYRHLGLNLPLDLCTAYEDYFEQKADKLNAMNDILNLHRLCEERRQLALITKRESNDKYYSMDEANRVSGKLNEERQHWQAIQAAEVQRKNDYLQNLNNKDLIFWRAELQKLRNTKVESDTYHMHQRLLGWLGLVLYSFSSRAVNDRMPEADRYVTLYHLLEPANAEADYLRAVLLARKGVSASELTKQLQQAVNHGFSEPDRLVGQVEFAGYAKDADFHRMFFASKANLAH